MYAVYPGPAGLKRIAQRVATLTSILASGLQALGYTLSHRDTLVQAFDTLAIKTGDATDSIATCAVSMGANVQKAWDSYIYVSLDETSTRDDVALLWKIFAKDGQTLPMVADFAATAAPMIPAALQRSSSYLTHPVFNTHHSETSMLRYIRRLSDFDLALDRSMIPLGSCTMKLNATAEMIPITWPEFANIHPFAPADQRLGYAELDAQLRAWLCQATGYAGISLQPNAGSQGEYLSLIHI